MLHSPYGLIMLGSVLRGEGGAEAGVFDLLLAVKYQGDNISMEPCGRPFVLKLCLQAQVITGFHLYSVVLIYCLMW